MNNPAHYMRDEEIKFKKWNGLKFETVTISKAQLTLLYTGCHDKNGNEIYEGDILLTNEENWKGVVVFSDGRFSLVDEYGYFSSFPQWSECEIVGSIYA